MKKIVSLIDNNHASTMSSAVECEQQRRLSELSQPFKTSVTSLEAPKPTSFKSLPTSELTITSKKLDYEDRSSNDPGEYTDQ